MSEGIRVKVLCVDDNDFVAEAVLAKLRKAGGFEWLGHLPSADELIEVARRDRPDVILLDVDMPGADPFEAMRELLGHCPDVRVIVFSGHVRPELLERAIRLGAWGYISKSDGENALVEGIRSVADGEFALSPEVEAICERG